MIRSAPSLGASSSSSLPLRGGVVALRGIIRGHQQMSLPPPRPGSFKGAICSAASRSAPSSKYVGTTFPRDIGDGDHGDDVLELQKLLMGMSKGYFSKDPTGFYGYDTTLAVKAWQEDNGIDPSGFMGPVSRERMEHLTGAARWNTWYARRRREARERRKATTSTAATSAGPAAGSGGAIAGGGGGGVAWGLAAAVVLLGAWAFRAPQQKEGDAGMLGIQLQIREVYAVLLAFPLALLRLALLPAATLLSGVVSWAASKSRTLLGGRDRIVTEEEMDQKLLESMDPDDITLPRDVEKELAMLGRAAAERGYMNPEFEKRMSLRRSVASLQVQVKREEAARRSATRMLARERERADRAEKLFGEQRGELERMKRDMVEMRDQMKVLRLTRDFKAQPPAPPPPAPPPPAPPPPALATSDAHDAGDEGGGDNVVGTLD